MTAAAPFVRRHVGLSETDLRAMLSRIGVPSLETLIAESVPASIRLGRALDLPPAASEQEALSELFAMMAYLTGHTIGLSCWDGWRRGRRP